MGAPNCVGTDAVAVALDCRPSSVQQGQQTEVPERFGPGLRWMPFRRPVSRLAA